MNPDIYQRLEAIEDRLRSTGFNSIAERIKDAMSGCTSSEILEESYNVLKQILAKESLPDDIKKEIKNIKFAIKRKLLKANFW